MYPFIRMTKEMIKHRNAPPLPLLGTHVSQHICWPWDIDMWMELNNGRTLTLYDLARIPLAQRTGLVKVLRDNRWGLTMAGASVRYRARVRAFQRIETHSRAVCWDERFLYLEQAMFDRKGTCCNHILYRSAVTGKGGIIPPSAVLAAMGLKETCPPMPEWVAAWIAADALRPWPPMQDAMQGTPAQDTLA
ncbi:acyl-CoA thioesterase [Poseidonocella sedimentorum]|uniref:Thioesterase-like superfamily protein n=1 Tax=Poseidonocella sedimentorum TaxID=871652 RepID=A0A1I6DNY6_9RHOB|nr:acyl-CoA thioesterase [Poseidonocella sedimentorum]SFR07154.1 Thioesterase-like superfamily protein [Poseidonocella sedimentorum]